MDRRSKILSYYFIVLGIIAAFSGAAVGIGNDEHFQNESTCMNCHDIMDDADSISSGNINPVDREAQPQKAKTRYSIMEAGNGDCISCHDINVPVGANKRIDSAAIKQGVHSNLNNGSGTQPLGFDPVNEACWACHGDGTQPAVQHPANYMIPYSCGDCHNRTANLSYTNSSRFSNITERKVSEHIQPPYYEHINSTINNSNANCQGCHDKSKIVFSDSGLSTAANVSHYASRTALVNPSTNCSLCHKNAQNASEYWANTIDHPARSQNDSFCDNCHNTTGSADLHDLNLTKPNNIHVGFDWQNDDNNEITPIGANEACRSCHGTHNTVYRICEDCHISGKVGPVIDSFTRSDINDTIPVVSAHTNFSSAVNVPNQSAVYSPSELQKTFSSCYSFNNGSLEGTCHGNSFKNISASSGYYAFKRISNDTRSTPYHFTQTIDRLPDTTDCIFCHNQSVAVTRKAWGNATQFTAGKHEWYQGSNNSKCWNCHVTTGEAPVDFHSDSVTKGGGDCISCHVPADVNISKFAGHANINKTDGEGNVTNNDCVTCHYKKDMNRNSVYLCESCHSNSSGIVPVNSSLIMSDFMHGITTCKTCHAPTLYHMKGEAGPLGNVETILKKPYLP